MRGLMVEWPMVSLIAPSEALGSNDTSAKTRATKLYRGGTNWMAALLWLEHFGLDLRRDNIMLQGTGEQVVRSQALESGKVDAAVIDMAFSKKLEQRGFNVLGDSQKTDIPFTGVDVVTTRGLHR